MPWRFIIISGLTLCLLAGAWIFKHSRGRLPAPAFGGQDIQVMLADHYNWQQRDPRWQEINLGNSAGTLGEYGCTVSAIANAVSNLGLELTPAELNQRLLDNAGFTERGWLIWGAINAATSGSMHATTFSSPSRRDIDRCLVEGDYPIIKYLIGGVVQHWVTVVGKDEGRYLIRDPLIDAASPVPLTSRTPIILSVRCIGRKSAAAQTPGTPMSAISPTPH